MDKKSKLLLILTNFLHCFCSGLLESTFIPHFRSNGGTPFSFGLLLSFLHIRTKTSKHFFVSFLLGHLPPPHVLLHSVLFENRHLYGIAVCLYSSFLAYMLLVLSSQLYMIMLCKIIHGLTNHVHTLSKEYVTKYRQTQIEVVQWINCAKVAGRVLGCISGAYVYGLCGSFVYLAMAVIQLYCLNFIKTLEPDPERKSSALSLLPPQSHTWTESVYKEKWNVFLLTFAYSFVFRIYFSRFILLSSPAEIDLTLIGLSMAFHYSVTYAYDLLGPFFHAKHPQFLFEYLLAFSACCLFVFSLFPSISVFYGSFSTVAVTFTLINSLLRIDILNLRPDRGAIEAANTLITLACLTGPLLFGVLVEYWGVRAFHLLLIFPAAACAHLVYKNVNALEVNFPEMYMSF